MSDIVKELEFITGLPYDWGKLKGKTLLISGGTGFIGNAIIDVIAMRNEVFNNDIRVISLSRHAKENKNNVIYFQADVTKDFEIPYNVDYVLHLASNTHPAQYATDPVGTIMTNVVGCEKLLEVVRTKKASRFVLASSVEVYGQCGMEPVDETYCGYIDCNTVRAGYNEAKRVCESLTQSYIKQYGIDASIVRLARCFGADKTKKDTKAMAQFIDAAVGGEDIVLKSKGEQRYSYCFYADAVSGIFKVMLDGKNGEAYNIAADDEGETLYDLACHIASVCGKKVCLDLDNSVEGASKATFALLNCNKIKELGWKPLYSVKQGIEITLNSLKSVR